MPTAPSQLSQGSGFPEEARLALLSFSQVKPHCCRSSGGDGLLDWFLTRQCGPTGLDYRNPIGVSHGVCKLVQMRSLGKGDARLELTEPRQYLWCGQQKHTGAKTYM